MNAPPAAALDDLRVIDLSDEIGAYCGKLLADMGADVIKVEPPEGDPVRGQAPFVEDEPGSERSLSFWYYNTSKRGITLDLESEQGRELFRKLVASADVVVESQQVGRLTSLGIDYADLREANPALIWVSITPYGREGPRAADPATDLTLAAGGGFAWMNGYDDHTLPPVRGGGQQAYHTGCHYGFLGCLVALLHRDLSGEGQLVDVNTNAGVNVTTEAGSYTWLVAQETVQRQTGRHASVAPSTPRQTQGADGRYVSAGIPPRKPSDFGVLHAWLEEEGLLEECMTAPILLAAAEGPPFSLAEIRSDEEVAAKFSAGNDAMILLAQRLPAEVFFHKGQEKGFQVGIIYSPEEAFDDEHFRDRGMAVAVAHPELGRDVLYPGAPYKLSRGGWRISRRPPLLGEHNHEVLAELGVDGAELEALASAGVV